MMTHLKSFAAVTVLIMFIGGCASSSEPIEEESAAPPPVVVEPEPVVVKEEPEPVAIVNPLPRIQVPEPEEPLQTIVYFDFDKAMLRPDAMDLLGRHADRLKDSSQTIQLEGHTDERGSKEYNIQLSEKRANAVREFLIELGVSATQINIVGFGEDKPQVIGNYESAWEKNRRVEIK